MALTYRKEPADQPGCWWILDGAGVEQIVDVVETFNERREPRFVAYEHGVGGFVELHRLHAVAWAGPLERPVKP